MWRLSPDVSGIDQWLLASGTDQGWIFGEKCSLTLAGLLFCWIALLAFFILARGFVSRVCGGVCGRQDALMMGVSMCAMLASPAHYVRAALVAAALLLFGSREASAQGETGRLTSL